MDEGKDADMAVVAVSAEGEQNDVDNDLTVMSAEGEQTMLPRIQRQWQQREQKNAVNQNQTPI